MRLKVNVDEIGLAVSKDPINPLLVASPLDSTVYYKKCFLGRFWTIFYFVASLFKGKDFANQKLGVAITKTEDLYQKCVLDTEGDIKKYRVMMQEMGTKKSIKYADYQKAKQNIRFWHGEIFPAIKLLNSFNSEEIKSISSRFPMPSFNSEKLPVDLLNIECQTTVEVPVQSLIKLSRKEELPLKEILQVDLWVEKIDRWADRKFIDIRTFHRGLRQMLALTSESSTLNLSEHLLELEYQLASGGENCRKCKIFKKEDIWHMKWREDTSNGKILGIINRRVQTVQVLNGADQVIAIADNVPYLGIKAKQLQHSWGFQPLQIELETQLRFAKVGFSNRFLHQIPWHDLSTEEKRKNIISIALHLQWMIKQNHTPKKLKASNIFLDEQNVLRSIKAHKPEDFFDFTILETFCRDCSQGNDEIFQLLMELSGLTKHPLALFHLQVIKVAFISDAPLKKIIEVLCVPEEISDAIDWKKERELFNFARQVFDDFQDFDPESFKNKKLLGETMWGVYQSSRSVYSFPANLKENVKELLAASGKILSKSESKLSTELIKYLDVMNLAIKIGKH